MSAPAAAWTSACSARIVAVVVVEHIAGRVDDPVMAVRGIGIERDVGQHADVRRGVLGRPDRAADQIVRVERLARIVGAQRRRRVREQGDAGNAEVARLPRPLADPVDRPARHAGQGRDRLLDPLPFGRRTAARSGPPGVSTVSATSARLQAVARVRRRRRAGKDGGGHRAGLSAPHPACKAANGAAPAIRYCAATIASVP